VNTIVKAGRYDLREELGRGAMGVVYHGFDPVIGRGVAVKTLRLSEAGTGLSREELIGRFQTEARAAGLLTHPNIVVVFDAGEEDGLFYITMEYVEGRSLQTLIDSHQPFPLPRVLKLMEQVCSALDFAHQHNVVHRDIKPANLMLTPDDVVKITDFGTAKILQFGTAQTAHVMGTPSYMSPEQVKGKPVDGRSDIFSLGVILYELLTGEKPFPGQNITTVIYKIINEEPIPPRSLDSSIHPGLSTVITRALAKDPNARYQSCHELMNALKNYHELATPDMTTRVAPGPPQPSQATSRPVASQPRPAVAAASATPAEPDPSVRMMLPVGYEEEPSRKPANLLLSLILLAVIGFAGYRVYPPIMDLWQRAHAPSDQAIAAKPETAAPTSSSQAPDAKPVESSGNAAPASAPAPANDVSGADKSVRQAIVPPVAPPVAPPAVAAKAPAAAPEITNTVEKSVVPQKPAAPAAPSAGRLLESKLRAELAASPLSQKVKLQSTLSTLTLSGSLNQAEHRELLAHLRTVPAGVRVIDDTEFQDDQKEAAPAASTPSAPAAATAGWIWVRSTPPGARIVVDGAETGLRTPARLELQPGQHEVQLVRRGFETVQRAVDVNQGQTIQLLATLSSE
jgi:serine/threonine protein kinase